MIGSFWNLCRACPSMPVDKLHSEYRSTYRWHEFAARATQAAPTRAPSGVTSQPEGRAVEPAMPRRKKYPGLAYKTNELFDAPPPPRQPRSKSEGPGRARWTDTVEDKPRAPALGDVELRPAGLATGAGHLHQSSGATGEPRKSASMGALRLAQQAADAGAADNVDGGAGDDRSDGVGAECEPLVPSNHHPIRKSTFRSALSAFISNGEDRSKDNRKRYKTEYKKKFRPFSQYVYEASKGTFTKCRGLKGRSQGDGDVVDKSTEAKDVPDGKNTGEGSWYREVLDLRKRAGEYKCRGWGTELAPDHIAQLYSKQMELWCAVSRRSSLAALALAPPPRAPPPPSAANSRAKSPKKVPPRSPHKQARKPQHSLDEAHPAQPEGRGSPRRRPRSADPRPAPSHQPTPQPNQQPTPQPPTKPTGLPLHGPPRSRRADPSPRAPRSPRLPQPEGADEEPLVKSPPEPTRVKSPEQLSIRSPEPVNWTVPLDTHTTFTVTQNVQPPPGESSEGSPVRRRTPSPRAPPARPLRPLPPLEERPQRHRLWGSPPVPPQPV